jgi:hypothetical protein
MNPDTVRLLRDRWALVTPRGPLAATPSCEQPFTIGPALQRRFRSSSLPPEVA